MPTSPSTSHGVGTVKEIGPGGLLRGTLAADFTLTPTGIPNVLLDAGTITISH